MEIKSLELKLALLGNHVLEIDDKTVLTSNTDGCKVYRISDDEEKLISSDYYDDISICYEREVFIVKQGEKYGLLGFNCEKLINVMYSNIEIIDNEIIGLQCGKVMDFTAFDFGMTMPTIYSGIDTVYKLGTKKYLMNMVGVDADLGTAHLWMVTESKCIKTPGGLIKVSDKYSTVESLIGLDENGDLLDLDLKTLEVNKVVGIKKENETVVVKLPDLRVLHRHGRLNRVYSK